MRIAVARDYGLLCKTCTATGCNDVPGPNGRKWIECTGCNGRPTGCKVCGGIGRLVVDRCPGETRAEMSEFFEFHEFFKAKTPPIVGGLLDQDASFIAAVRLCDREEARVKAELGIR